MPTPNCAWYAKPANAEIGVPRERSGIAAVAQVVRAQMMGVKALDTFARRPEGLRAQCAARGVLGDVQQDATQKPRVCLSSFNALAARAGRPELHKNAASRSQRAPLLSISSPEKPESKS